MSGRDTILGKVRGALGATPGDGRAEAVSARLGARARNLVPERAKKPREELARQLRHYLEGQSATVIEVASRNEIPAAVSSYLRGANLPQRLRSGADPYLAALPWSVAPQLEREPGRAAPDDEVGLTHAVAAVSETGTLVLASGADNPVTLAFLPETHIVVVEASAIVGAYEDAWSLVRERYGPHTLPRTVNMVSGPSRTGDIGGQLVMGAHGPRRLCVILVQEGA